MSWFESTGLTSAFDTLTHTVQKAKDKVNDAIPTEHKELLAKLTLNTDEMIETRQNFRDEAARKEQAKDRLNKLLPWETLDAEREILVEECKEAILELSSRKETFFGPYEMPLLNVQFEAEDTVEGEGEEADMSKSLAEKMISEGFAKDGEEHNTSEEQVGTDVVEEIESSEDQNYHMLPSEESREKLQKLEPLPPLLEDFDLDVHVGLIQKILKEDGGLVNMQASLSGGGEREKVFWRNYFFHCAFTRYEAGLSIDEIWSYQDEPNIVHDQEIILIENTADGNEVCDENEEEAVIFNSGEACEDTFHAAADEGASADICSDGGSAPKTDASLAALSEGSPGTNNGFELLDDSLDGDISGDPVLDELEAEIARELED